MNKLWYFIFKTNQTFEHSSPLKSSPGSHWQSVSNSVGTRIICSLLMFPLSVSLVSSCLRCLCFSVSVSNLLLCYTTHCSYTKQPSELPKSTKVKLHGNNVCNLIIAHMISMNAQTHKFLHMYFYLVHRPPNHIWPCYQNSNIIFT